MSFEEHSKTSATGVIVACLAGVGAAVAVAVWLRSVRRSNPQRLVDRCRQTIEELEQRVLSSVQA